MPKGLQGFQKGHKFLGNEETKKKISLALKGKLHSEEHNKKVSLALKGRKCPWIWKTHEKIRGRKQSKERIEKRVSQYRGRNHWLFGKTHTEEVKKKIGAFFRGRPISEEHKTKISKYLKEHPEHPGLNYWKERRGTPQFMEMISKRLKSIKHCNTSIELKLQNLLKENNIEFETHYPVLGHPDIFIKPNICIFADGCYWHKCPQCGYNDLEINEKDLKITRELQSQSYIVIRVWEHDINKNLNECFNKIISN